MTTEERFRKNKAWLFTQAGLSPDMVWPKNSMGWRHSLPRRFSITKHQFHLLLWAVDVEESWANLQERKQETRIRIKSRSISQGNRTKAKLRRQAGYKKSTKRPSPAYWSMNFVKSRHGGI